MQHLDDRHIDYALDVMSELLAENKDDLDAAYQESGKRIGNNDICDRMLQVSLNVIFAEHGESIKVTIGQSFLRGRRIKGKKFGVVDEPQNKLPGM